MHIIKKHHRLTALLLSLLMLVGMIPLTAVGTAAAEVDVAEDAAQVDVADTGVAYQALEGISVENLSFETSSTYPWTIVEGSSPTALASGNYHVASSSSYLRVTAATSGLLSFKYYVSSQSSDYFYFKKAVSGSGDNVEPSSGYLRRVYGNTSYDTYDKIKTRWQTTSSTNIQMDAGDFIVFSYKKNASTDQGGDTAWTSGFTFTALDKTTITFHSNIPEHGWISKSNDVTTAHVDSVTGLATTSAGTFYAIPDIDNDYTFDGLYTDPSYAEEYKVASLSYNNRGFTLYYPEEDTDYYAKFSQRTSDSDVFFYVNYDDTKLKDVIYYRYSAFANTGDLTYGSAISGNKIPVDPDEPIRVKEDDLIYFEYAPADGLTASDIVYDGLYSGNTKVDFVPGGIGGMIGGGGSSVAEVKLAATAERNRDVITITVQSNDYTPIEGYDSPAYLDVLSRTSYKWVADTLDDEDVIRSNNPQMEDTFSFMKIVPQMAGTVNFDVKADLSFGHTFLRFEKQNTDLTEDEKNVILQALWYGGELDAWTYADFFMDEDDYDGDWDAMYEAAEEEVAIFNEHFAATTLYPYTDAGNWRTISLHVNEGEEIHLAFYINSAYYIDEFAYVKNIEFVPDTGEAHTLTFHNVSGQEGWGGMSTTQKADSIVSTAKVYEGPALTMYGLSSSNAYSFEGLYRDSALTQRIESSINNNDKDFVTLSYEDFTGDTDLWVNFIDNSYQPLSGYTAPGATVKTRARHAWTVDSDGNLVSGNSGIVGSGSYLSITADRDGIFAAELKAPNGYNDYLNVTVNGTEPTNFNYARSWNSVSDWTLYTTQVQAGDEIRFAFLKVYDSFASSEVSNGTDVAYLRKIRVANGTITYNVAAYDDAGYEVADSDYANFNYKVEDVSGDDPVLVGDIVSGETDSDITADAGKRVTLTACPQDEASQFLRWVTVDPATGVETLYSADPEISILATEDLNLRAVFCDYVIDDYAVAVIGTTKYGSVSGAINVAIPGETVVVLKGQQELDDNATVKKGVTLLIPFNDEHTLYTKHTSNSEYTGGTSEGFSSSQITKSANAYCKLTIPEGLTLTVEDGGAVSVSAKNISGYNNNNLVGPVAGKYGQIVLNGDIVVNEGGSLYAWGFITGSGMVTAKSGSKVYEYFQIYDFRGGTITVNFVGAGSNQFPFNQYYIQNIESKIIYEYGATEYVNMAIFAGGTITVAQAEFIGDNGVFVLGEGSSLYRRYDAPNDKMYYEFSGSARIEDISMNVYVNISSEAYYLPINNIAITMKSGSTLDLDKKVIFLPGSSLTIEDGATLTVEEGAGLVFAGEGIDKYSASGATLLSPAHPVTFAASEDWQPRVVLGSSCTNNTSKSNMANYVANNPATLNNNGTVIVEEGAALVSTEDGAAIYSSDDTGAFKISGDNTLSDPLDRYVDSDNRTVLVRSEEVNLMNDHDHPTDGVQSTADRWSDSIDAFYTMKDGVWGDWRNVTFYDDNDQLLGSKDDLSVTDKNNVHDWDSKLAGVGAFDDAHENYYKYVGEWEYTESNNALIAKPAAEKTVPVSIFEKHSLTLNGDVGVNFYLFDAPAGATMSYSWGDKYISDDTYSTTEHYTATSAITASGDYKLASVSVAPKEIGDTITVNMMLDGNVISTETYSAADYLNTVISNDAKALEVCDNDDAKAAALQALCTSMLQYGAACQMQFGYKTDDLVSNDYLNVSTDFGDILNSDYETDYPKNGDTVPDFIFMGYTMTLNSETVLDLVFKNETGNEYPEFTVTGATPVRLSEGKYYMFDVTDIKINELLNNRTVTINGQNMTVNAGTYIYKAITTQQSDDTLMATMKNLYNYYQKATTFFAIA